MKPDHIIHLPTFSPARRPFPNVPLDRVKAPTDLPPYLFPGPLDESAFSCGAKGWSATWRRDSGTWLRIDYDADDRRIDARDAWLGVDGAFSSLHKPDLRLLWQMRFMSPNAVWEKKAEETLEARWNLKYVAADKQGLQVAGLPDGPMKTLVLPVPADRLPHLVEAFAGLRGKELLDFPVSGYVLPALGTVNYVEGKNPPWASNPDALYLASFQATGLPPIDSPAREEARDGSAAWTVRRLAYLAFIGVPFAGLVPLLEYLGRSALIPAGPMASGSDPGTESVEFSACVVPAGVEIGSESLAWWPSDRKRRVFWQMPGGHMRIFEDHAAHRDDPPDNARARASALAAESAGWLRQLDGEAS